MTRNGIRIHNFDSIENHCKICRDGRTITISHNPDDLTARAWEEPDEKVLAAALKKLTQKYPNGFYVTPDGLIRGNGKAEDETGRDTKNINPEVS